MTHLETFRSWRGSYSSFLSAVVLLWFRQERGGLPGLPADVLRSSALSAFFGGACLISFAVVHAPCAPDQALAEEPIPCNIEKTGNGWVLYRASKWA